MGNVGIERRSGTSLKFLEVPNNVYQISVLHPDTLEILGFFVKLDVFELLLKFEGITHLVEKEGNHNVTPSIKGVIPFLLVGLD